MEEFNYAKSFSEHIKDNRGKYAIVVSKSQCAIISDDIKRTSTHDDLYKKLLEKMRPDLQFDYFGNVLNANERISDNSVVIFGYPHYFQLHMTELFQLSPEQFKCITEMLLILKNENEKVDAKGYGRKYEVRAYGSPIYKLEYKDDYGDSIDELIEQLSSYVEEARVIPNENIIGTPISQKISKDKSEQILSNEYLVNFDNIDWNNDFPIYTEDEHKKLGYSTILILTLITGIISIVILVLGMIINTL